MDQLVEFDPPDVGPAAIMAEGTIDGHVQKNLKRKLPRLRLHPGRAGVFAIVGGGPSLGVYLPRLYDLRCPPDAIITVPGSHGFLISQKIVPNYCAIAEVNTDPRLLGETPHEGVTYLASSHCHDSTFDHLKNNKVIMWHSWTGNSTTRRLMEDDGYPVVGGGCTTVMRCINLGLVLGYRQIEMFGCDSSFDSTNKSHYYHSHHPDYVVENYIDIEFNGRWYKTAHYLAKQASEFKRFMQYHGEKLPEVLPAPHQWSMKVHGSGLLPDIFKHICPEA